MHTVHTRMPDRQSTETCKLTSTKWAILLWLTAFTECFLTILFTFWRLSSVKIVVKSQFWKYSCHAVWLPTILWWHFDIPRHLTPATTSSLQLVLVKRQRHAAQYTQRKAFPFTKSQRPKGKHVSIVPLWSIYPYFDRFWCTPVSVNTRSDASVSKDSCSVSYTVIIHESLLTDSVEVHIQYISCCDDIMRNTKKNKVLIRSVFFSSCVPPSCRALLKEINTKSRVYNTMHRWIRGPR